MVGFKAICWEFFRYRSIQLAGVDIPSTFLAGPPVGGALLAPLLVFRYHESFDFHWMLFCPDGSILDLS